MADKMKKWYVTKHMKFDVNTMVAGELALLPCLACLTALFAVS
mgnify:CR=1 FL=1